MHRTLLMSALFLLHAFPALAERPTTGGLFAYALDDVLTYHDDPDGMIRVHYSIEGPNAVNLSDTDANGIPDYVEMVTDTALETLELFANTLAVSPPKPETDFILSDDGGSAAMDFYLVDFQGNSDGFFGTDACNDTNQCTGHMVVENDFRGYGYSSAREGLETVVPHELFHAVQAAYNGALPVWFSEGGAVWAERIFDPDSRDFFYYANAYLEDTGRSLTNPPAGPVPTFAYSTGLFWHFLSERHDARLMHELLLGSEGLTTDEAVIESIDATLAQRGDTMVAAWFDFAIANLGTGARAGLLDSHPEAASLSGVRAEAENRTIDDKERFYPLAATYYRIDHIGGPLYQSTDEALQTLIFSLHPVANGAADGPVEPAVTTWDASQTGPNLLADDLGAGGYWVIAANTALHGTSSRVRLCIGTESLSQNCTAVSSHETAHTGVESEPTEAAGGCQQLGLSPSMILVATMLRFVRRRRTTNPANQRSR